ncbi:CPBP family intramembrane glutamic endopeptidase [Anaerocolumna xylanovorans]|nr:type II CAAX endopeptidase family protein [Anaerocolumna xylanovorans]
MKKAGKYLAPVLPLLMAFVIQILGGIWVGLIYAVVKGVQLASQDGLDMETVQEAITNDLQNPEFLLLLSAVLGVIDIIVFGIWLKKLKRQEETIEQANSLSVQRVLLIIVLGLCLQIGLSAILTLISHLRPEWFEEYGKLMEQLGMGTSFFSFLYVGIIGPIAEELICRGVIMKKARRVMPFFAANILQALLFGIYHMNMVQGLYAFAIGLCFGLMRYTFNTLAAPIALHMSVNLSGIFLGYFLSDKVLLNPVTGVPLFALSAAGIILILIHFIKLSKKVGLEEVPYTYDEY